MNEFLIEEVTALTIYQAAQPRPTTELELNALHLTAREQRDLVRFLKNPVLFKAPEEES